ncbi:MIZ zinc finger family protein [Aphelenchoides besseyi]|nr:MIZ zinc finger family protein [Aphelenchoides besseyi]
MGSGQSKRSNDQTIDPHQVKLVDRPPFYAQISTLLCASALANGNQSEMRAHSFRFSIPQTYLSEISEDEFNPFPHFKVHLRMGLLDTSKEQQDKYPKDVSANINGTTIKFPTLDDIEERILPPVDISLACLPIRDEYQLGIKWQNDGTNYFVGVYVVVYWTPAILHCMVANKDHYYLEETRQIIRKSFEKNGEDDIALDSLKVSLLCPLSLTIMRIPSRSRCCSHLQCFDLFNYLKMNEQRPTWKCPICRNASPYSSLVVDGYFFEIIRKANGAAKYVELLPNTGFKIVKEKEPQYLNAQGLSIEVQKRETRAKTSHRSTTIHRHNLEQRIQNKITDNAFYAFYSLAIQNARETRRRRITQLLGRSVPDVITLDSDSEDDSSH